MSAGVSAGFVLCVDCNAAREVTAHGTCGACGSASVLRRPLLSWPWQQKRAPRPSSRVVAFVREARRG